MATTVYIAGMIAEGKKSETIAVRLTPQAKEALVRIARADKRKPGQLAAIILEEWLEAHAKTASSVQSD